MGAKPALSGACGTRPSVGLCPTTPQQAAGIRIEPPPSVPSASATWPAASAAAEPLLEPPGVCPADQGLRVAGPSGLWPKARCPYSGIAVMPTITAPAARSRATAGPSACSRLPFVKSDPTSRGSPATATCSFTATGTPASGPGVAPRACAASSAAAAARAPSASTWRKACRASSVAAIRSSAASTASPALIRPSRTAAAISLAEA